MIRSSLNPRSRRRSVHLAAVVFAVVLTLATFGSALAHANLVRSDPAAGASLAASPARVQLWYSEDLEPSFSQAVIYDTNRQRVDQGDSHVAPDDPRSLIVGVKPNLPKGTYVVAWVTQSRVDGHVVRGLVPFGIGVAVAPADTTAQAPVQGPVSGSPVEMALRWLILLAAAGLVGSFAFWTLQTGAISTDRTSPLATITPGQVRVAAVSWLVFLLGNVALLLLQTSIAANVPILAVFGSPLVLVLTQTQYGGLWLARVGLAAILGLIIFARARSIRLSPTTWDRLGLALGAALLLTISLTSHSASVSLTTPVGLVPGLLVVDWLHLAAVAIWIGGLLQLAVVIPAILKSGAGRVVALGALIPRFSVVAGVALGVVGLTGLVQALVDVGTLDNLLGKDYGQALLAKIVLIVPLIAIAAVNHYVIRPALARGRASQTPTTIRHAADAAGLLKWTVRIEVGFAVAVIAAVGVMTSLSPAQQPSASAGTGPLSLTAPAGDLVATLAVSPGSPGPNRYAVDVRTANGQPATKLDRVTLRLTFLDSDLGASDVVLTAAPNGHFDGQGSELAVAGRWQAEAIVRRAGQDDVTATYGFSVTPSGAQTIQAPQLQVSGLFWVGVLLALFGLSAIGRGLVLRGDDLRRAGIVAALGLGLCGAGGYVAFQDVMVARAQEQALAQSQIHPATPQSIANGALVFRQNCVMCHGLDAHGDGPLAPTLNPRPSDLILHVPLHPDADLEFWIANGFPGSAMPAFQSTLSDQDRWDVLNYLKAQVGSAANAGAASATAPGTTAPGGTPPAAATPNSPLAPATAGTPATSASTPGPSTPGSTLSIGTPALAGSTPLTEAASPPSQAGSPPSTVTTSASTIATTALPVATSTPLPANGGLTQRRTVDGLDVTLQIQPRIFSPAEIDLTVHDANGQPAQSVQSVDLQVAMEGMDHGARGIVAVQTGPGAYRAQAMLLVMQGPWWLALRLQRPDGKISSTLFRFQTPKDNSTGAVSAMYERPTDPVQIEDIAVYPGSISPPQIAVKAGHPVHLEVLYVDHPACGQTVSVASPAAQSTLTPDGLADLSFVPPQSGQLQLTCTASGLVAQNSAAGG